MTIENEEAPITFSTPHIYNPKTKRVAPLKNFQPFIMYIERQSKSGNFYAVGQNGSYFGYCDNNNHRRATRFILHNDSVGDFQTLTLSTAKNAKLRRKEGDTWYTMGQLNGKWASKFTTQDFQKFTHFVYNSGDHGYRLRMDIKAGGDAWISDDEDNDKIRMRDSEGDRAIIYFCTFTDDFNDPQNGGDYPVYTKNDFK